MGAGVLFSLAAARAVPGRQAAVRFGELPICDCRLPIWKLDGANLARELSENRQSQIINHK
jgi:hypothetical protein